MFKKVIALLLAALLVFPAISSLAEAPITIHVFGTGTTLPEDDPILPELSRQLGFNVVLENPTADAAALTGRILNGDIPDVFVVNNIKSISTYLDSDAVLCISDHMDLIPHIAESYSEDYWYPVTFDGKIYAIPPRAQVNYMEWYMRYDWLEKLGLPTPTNFDELLEVCIAMKKADFDGNGIEDTYPISGVGLESRNGAFNGFFTAYGVTQPCTVMIRNNEAVYATTLPEFRMAVEEIRRFVEAGVVDPEVVSNNFNALREKAATGKIGICYGGWTEISKAAYQEIIKAVDPEADWHHFEKPIVTPYGESGATKTAVGFSRTYCLSADLEEQPERLAAALKLFDYITYGAGDRLMSYGIEDVHYRLEGDKVIKLDAMSGLTYGSTLQFTGRDDMVYCMTKFAECEDEIRYAAEEETVLYHYGDFVQQPEGVNYADIKSYETQTIIEFIFGQRDMSEWDSFIETLNTVYNLKAYIEHANETLKELGYIK